MSSLFKYSSRGMLALFICVGLCLPYGVSSAAEVLSSQTDVDRAAHSVDENGIPLLNIKGLGMVNHPAWTALYALAYAGVEDYDPSLGLKPDDSKFKANVKWLVDNLKKNPQGQWVWLYKFDSTYNDVSIKAPWDSAFAQATGIQALLADWKKTGDEKSLAAARKAAESLFVPLKSGGFLFTSGDDIWFEEIPSSINNPSHILNGHMRVLLALRELAEVTGDSVYTKWFDKGANTLERWLPLYDASYWLRYDLNAKKDEQLFRLANPYGFANPELAIDKITLSDPETGKNAVLDVGGAGDGEGSLRIAGNDWGQIETVDGRSVRKLKSVMGEKEPADSDGKMVAPYSYFYMALPAKWTNNLRTRRLELSVEYLDASPGNIAVQMRSIAPGSDTFKNLPDSDLLLSGSGQWRQWKVAVKPENLGYWVGDTYAKKHAEYLQKLALIRPSLQKWSDVATGYLNVRKKDSEYKVVEQTAHKVPSQSPMLPIFSLDKDGVVMQWRASEKTKYLKDGSYDPASDPGEPVYSPFIVARQYLQPEAVGQGGYRGVDKNLVKSKSALDWFLSPHHQVKLPSSAVTYLFNFENTYNDVTTKANWPSAFSQAYVLEALSTAHSKPDSSSKIPALIEKVANAYTVSVKDGGVSSVNRAGQPYFEEVPNATHVLNAHLISIPGLKNAAKLLNSARINAIADSGIDTLRTELNQFDTGYWMRYDLNPKKELLFQLDWIDGESSPLIEEIQLLAPQFQKSVKLELGKDSAFEGGTRISGSEWLPSTVVDQRSVRGFVDGYKNNSTAVSGGTRHNAYFFAELPQREFTSYFDVQPHRLIVKYKDVAPGHFNIKLQALNEGNVLSFVPLRGGLLTMVGDQQWKEAVFEVRPQDMGWYKGADYQVFEVEQLKRIADISNDWFFQQYAERQKYFLDAKAANKPVIIEPQEDDEAEVISASVEAASDTYANFSFSNALDGNPSNDYVAGIEGEQSAFVNLKMSSPIKDGVLKLQWENKSNYPANVKIHLLDEHGDTLEVFSNAVSSSDKPYSFKFSGAQAFQHMKLEFSGFSGQPRLLLRLIEIKATPVVLPQAASADLNNSKFFLSAEDPANPLRIFHQSISLSMKKLSDKLSVGANTDHEKVMKFMEYISGFGVGVASENTPDATVSERIGACGSFTNTLLALAAAQGIEGRVISLLNYPKNDGHAVAELKFGDAWHLYDPTYNAYYTWQNSTVPLSFAEVQDAYKRFKFVRVRHKTTRLGLAAFTGKNIFTKANPSGVSGPDKPMTFPLKMAFGSHAEITEKGFGPAMQGANFIGAGSTNQNQEWTLNKLTPGKNYLFSVRPKDLFGNIDGAAPFFDVSIVIDGDVTSKFSHRFDFSKKTTPPMEIKFTAKSTEAKISILHDYVDPKYMFMTVSGYSLVAI
ncbi:D-glucuronyl C5-epimerase family protein [Pseudomonas sp. B28(2017)]|uniref:D-glucuronyl C5-epimerase family protein n=1 Tax=Pseudomonas sp. B28(2017) TaxID=1981730 RepID=UPI000A1E16A1|nr:D-glucuronyl C5-epimerase family protein [Pseudomonas sp. B28(2017)]